MLKTTLQKAEELWLKEDLILAKPIAPNDVITAFNNFGVSVSKDVSEVYSNLGGMKDWRMDSICFSFWTFERILEENKPNSELIFFADFLINSHFYGFKFENENVSSIHIYYGENDVEKVSDSFYEFFEIYLNESEKLSLFARESEKILKL
jgi:hypothetical protein